MKEMEDPYNWGPGNKLNAKAFTTTTVGAPDQERQIELFFGEHPHSRMDNSVYARDDSGFTAGFSGHHSPVSIIVEEYNYLKSSGLSGDEYRRACNTKVLIARKHVYTLGHGRDWLYAVTRLPDVVTRLQEHPVRFWSDEDIRSLEGRKVWYADQPAVVRRWSPDMGVFIESVNGRFRPPGWAQASQDQIDNWNDEYAEGLYIDVLDARINWFRD
jgi:hypothetical protein